MVNNNLKLTPEHLRTILPDFERWLLTSRGVSDSTYKHHYYQIRKILDNVTIYDKENLQDFIIGLRKVKKPGTVENYIFTIRIFCKFLVENGILNYNFGKDFMLPKRESNIPNILSISEIQKILETNIPSSYSRYPKPELARKYFDTVLELLVKTGTRLGEVMNMKIGDVNWIDGVWSLKLTKTRHGRLVPIPPEVLRTMSVLAGKRPPDQPVFINVYTGLKMKNGNVQVNFNRRVKKAGINKNVTVHTLRHSFITELLRQDVSVLKIANIVGHENIKTTQDYAKLLYEDLRDAILRHPLTAKDRDPQDIMNQLKETIKKFHLQEDPRFVCKLTEVNNQFQLSIMIV
jgi:integrase/recombinase XerD